MISNSAQVDAVEPTLIPITVHLEQTLPQMHSLPLEVILDLDLQIRTALSHQMIDPVPPPQANGDSQHRHCQTGTTSLV